MLKKISSLIIVLSMVLCMACTSVFAAEEAYATESDLSEVSTEAVDTSVGDQAAESDSTLSPMADADIWAKDHQTNFEVGVNQKLKIAFLTTGGCDGMVRTMSFKSSDKSVVEIVDKVGGSDKGAGWVKIKGLKEGTAVLTATVKAGFAAPSKKGEIYCSTQVLITVKGSGSTDPKPEPEPEPDPPAKTPVVESSESSVNLKTNEEHSVLISTNLTSDEFDHINVSSKNGFVSATMGKQASDTSYYLNIKGLKAGSDVITVTLEKTKTNGEKVLASTKINVSVTTPAGPAPTDATTSIWSSESSITLSVNQTYTVVITENGKSDEFYYLNSNKKCVTADWGNWVDSSQHSCYLNLKGVKAGSAVITISAKDSNGNVLASSKINVTVKDSGGTDSSKPGKTGLKVKKATKKLISLSWNKVSKADGYEVWLSIKGNPKTFRVYNTSYKINLTGGKSKMAYQVKVRAFRTVNGKTIYGKWTTKKGKLK